MTDQPNGAGAAGPARPWSERQRASLRALRRALRDRAQREADVARAYRERSQATEHEFNAARQHLEEVLAAAQAEALGWIEDGGRQLQERFDGIRQTVQNEHGQQKSRILAEYGRDKQKLLTETQEARWTTNAQFEADRKVARDLLVDRQRSSKAMVATIGRQRKEAHELCKRWRFVGPLMPAETVKVPGQADPWQALQQCAEQAEFDLAALHALRAPNWLRGVRPWLFVAALWLILSLPGVLLGLFLDSVWFLWPLATTTLVPLLGWDVVRRARRRASDQAIALYDALGRAVSNARALLIVCLTQARDAYREKRRQSSERTRALLAGIAASAKQKVTELRSIRDQQLRSLNEQLRNRLTQVERQRVVERRALETNSGQAQSQAQSRHEDELKQARQRLIKAREESNRLHAEEWTGLLRDWKAACESFVRVNGEITTACERCFPAWSADLRPATEVPLGLPFGAFKFDPAALPGGQPKDKQLPPLDVARLRFPALLPFPERASLLIRASGAEKAAALKALQALLLRCWLALPPGKVRATVIDPVGRGENFAAFMHLADHDENLIGGRIWTEPAHIEQRLTDLTGHVENVLQKYLRNEYQSLAEYNVRAGEVAEPFRYLVVADFPVNFSDDAARRLLSLAAAGARCGVYTFIVHDPTQPLPHGFTTDDLERACTLVTWQKDRFVWEDDDYRDLPLSLAVPPDADRCTALLGQVGEEAKRASRVEVPFDHLVPPREQWWTTESRDGVVVPIGRAGARAPQLLQLGQGTAQHALIAGKTGSGKSTLLHVLVTQVALRYSPSEVELYLIDFKKGVEFKSYATYALPHARVVAVESEREFGLSVLQRLDAELSRRGELFRAQGVTDLSDYRAAADRARAAGTPLPAMPRVLLVVDEFQEFFVEDDKLAQDASLLMDRLVRQGRAFGVHVILGSQTLGGAYSLARSTIDQMAVRIALQCSEADAHLILSRENTEARLLSRPGEAIYNAAHGLLEGNHLFQVVWLADARRDELLRQVRDLGQQREQVSAPIVFEGSAPADLTGSAPLRRLLQEPPTSAMPWQALLGDAVAIKEPTSAVFRRQSGANLLLLGQHEETAFGLTAASLISLAARVDSTNGESPLTLVVASSPGPAGEAFIPALTEALPLRLAAPRELPPMLAQLVEEVDRRMNSPAGPPLFLCLFGLQRLRDLRRPEDDFGLSRREEKASPYRQFMHILKEGPPVGVHTLLWCDTLTNLQRSLDRQALREFDQRVLMQMSAADSSTIIDTPLASRLGPHRAYFWSEDQGRLEKFRPYALPALDWLRQLRRALMTT